MVDWSYIPSSIRTTPIRDVSELLGYARYGLIQPSFSFWNTTIGLLEAVMSISFVLAQINKYPVIYQKMCIADQKPHVYVVGNASGGIRLFSIYTLFLQAIEQGLSEAEKGAQSPAQSPLPPTSSLPSNPGTFSSGSAVQVMAHPGPPFVVPEGNSSHAGNYSFNANLLPNQTNQSQTTDVRADGSQEVGAITSAPAAMQSVSQPRPNASPAATHFASNNFNNMTSWMPLPAPATFHMPARMAKNPATPGPAGLVSFVHSPSTSTIQTSSHDSTALRTFMPAAPVLPNPPIQHNAAAMYPSASPQAAPPGPWLPPHHIGGFARPSFSPYAAVVPGPFPMPIRSTPPQSVSYPDIQPPGVSPSVPAIGAPTTSFTAGSQSSVGSGQAELPPGIDNREHVVNAETKDEAPSKEQLEAWTAHRTETGIVYYYNALTGQSTYEKPSGFKGESDRATVQPTSISWEKLSGTEWTLVTTNDGKKYYYNTVTKVSSWQIPSELTELRKKHDADALKAQSVSVTNTNIVTEKGSDLVSLSTPAANTGGRDAIAVRSSGASASSSALDLIKKKLQDSGIPDSSSTSPAVSGSVASEVNGSNPLEATYKSLQNDNNKDKNGDGDMSNSSSDSEDEDGGPTKEECILQFKEMLKERGVAPFSKWEKELPKIVFDPRFKAIPNQSARRALFEHYVRTRAEEERKEKRAAQKAALEGFKQILEEAKEDIDHNTDYQTFKRRWGEDPRFQALDRKDRENLLNERVLFLKRSAQEKALAERAVGVSNFKLMLKDKGDITSTSRWSKVKDSLRSNPRYKSVKHEDREKLFNEYLAELRAAEEETAQKAKAKLDEEDKLKERERALRKRKEREEQEVERVRQKARRKEAVESYHSLLVETIKDPQASWSESKLKLEKDPQGRVANPHLDKSDFEKLFREHVKSLQERCAQEFRVMLAEVITQEAAAQETEDGKTILTSWSTAKQLLKNDPRYNKMPRKERESLWRRHAEEIQRKQKKDQDQGEKPADGKSKISLDSGKHPSGSSRRTHDRR
ncbi:pre-mRNA-processing protein 40C [Perilla frutescens var. frutescens]|nr:pre-mRNA-processing protein 40C [Perilla frutescens var. frutescens]